MSRHYMHKVVSFFKNEHIIAAIFTGASILAISLVLKRLLDTEPTDLESSLPGFAFIGFQVARTRAKRRFWKKPLPWCALCIMITAAVILRHAF